MRNISLDVMKVILALMVVGIHTSFLADINETISYVFNQGLFRIAVPIFFIVNGYYFSTAVDSGKAKEWVAKILGLYSIWSLIYVYYWFDLGSASLIDIAKVFHTILFGYFHLWYLPAAIGAAAMVYFCRKLPAAFLSVLLACAFSAGVLIQYFGNYHVVDYVLFDKMLNMGWVYRNFIFSGFPFFGVGYLLARNSLESKITLGQSVLISAVGIICIFFEAYLNYSLIGKSESFDLLVSLPLAAPFIFILFKKINVVGDGRTLSLYASGIYFVHPLLIYTVWGYDIRATPLTLTVILFSVLVTTLLIVLNRKLKFIL